MTTETTIPNGTTIRLVPDEHGNTMIVCDHPDAPAEVRNLAVGRAIEGCFQSPIFPPPVGLTPWALRAIADLLEEAE